MWPRYSLRMSTKLKVIILVQLLVIGAFGIDAWKRYGGSKMKRVNPVGYFEIPVSDLERAMSFYGQVFGYDFVVEEIHGNRMAMFPFSKESSGVTGALAQGEIYRPSLEGSLVYFSVESIDETIRRAEKAGGSTLFPKTQAGEYGFVAELKDSEGNRIGLSEIEQSKP